MVKLVKAYNFLGIGFDNCASLIEPKEDVRLHYLPASMMYMNISIGTVLKMLG